MAAVGAGRRCRAQPGFEGVRRLPWEAVDAISDLSALQPPPGTLVEPVGPIAAAVRPGDPIASSPAGMATAGLPVTLKVPLPSGETEGFLTVAHGVPQKGGRVSAVSRNGSRINGQVEYRDCTARGLAGGDDIALVTLPGGPSAACCPTRALCPGWRAPVSDVARRHPCEPVQTRARSGHRRPAPAG